jgi:hypothetical protein
MGKGQAASRLAPPAHQLLNEGEADIKALGYIGLCLIARFNNSYYSFS